MSEEGKPKYGHLIGKIACPKCKSLKIKLLKVSGKLVRARCSMCGFRFYKYLESGSSEGQG